MNVTAVIYMTSERHIVVLSCGADSDLLNNKSARHENKIMKTTNQNANNRRPQGQLALDGHKSDATRGRRPTGWQERGHLPGNPLKYYPRNNGAASWSVQRRSTVKQIKNIAGDGARDAAARSGAASCRRRDARIK